MKRSSIVVALIIALTTIFIPYGKFVYFTAPVYYYFFRNAILVGFGLMIVAGLMVYAALKLDENSKFKIWLNILSPVICLNMIVPVINGFSAMESVTPAGEVVGENIISVAPAIILIATAALSVMELVRVIKLKFNKN